jgi:hypothetical protein
MPLANSPSTHRKSQSYKRCQLFESKFADSTHTDFVSVIRDLPWPNPVAGFHLTLGGSCQRAFPEGLCFCFYTVKPMLRDGCWAHDNSQGPFPAIQHLISSSYQWTGTTSHEMLRSMIKNLDFLLRLIGNWVVFGKVFLLFETSKLISGQVLFIYFYSLLEDLCFTFFVHF